MNFEDALMWKAYHILNNKASRDAFIKLIGDENIKQLMIDTTEDFDDAETRFLNRDSDEKLIRDVLVKVPRFQSPDELTKAVNLLIAGESQHVNVPDLIVVDSVIFGDEIQPKAESYSINQKFVWLENIFKLSGTPSERLRDDLKDYSVIYGTNSDGDGFDLTKKYIIEMGYAVPIEKVDPAVLAEITKKTKNKSKAAVIDTPVERV